MMSAFDFSEFKRALQSQDAVGRARFYADDAEWIEYRHALPPKAPNVMRGQTAIAAFIRRVSAQPLKLTIEDEIIGDGRAAYRLTVELGDRRRIIEHVMIYFRDGKIVRRARAPRRTGKRA